jgi:lipopolysaccharide transport system ATP-binding protein
MSLPVISVENLSKRYVIGHESRHDNLRDTLHHTARKLWRRFRWGTGFTTEEFWALRDVSFTVNQGEVVGIIGRNGAGKSTLLKILSRITEPTQGRVTIRGRVASLLEVGTGFHPELTGRENIFLNGAILGMSRAEIARKFDEIVAFAEVEKFLDTPVKHYSSGMYVRLAFAVAAHLEPEILIVDEVLAVGDAQFQQKCLGKMRDVTNREGRTIIFVSHDMAAITSLTSRCLLLHHGATVCFDATNDTVGKYFELGETWQQIHDAVDRTDDRPYVRRVQIRTSHQAGRQATGQAMEVIIELRHPKPVVGACLSFQILNQFQQAATHAWLFDADAPYARRSGTTILTCTLPKVHLNVGHYSLRLFFSEPPGGQVFDTLDRICPFEVVRVGETTLWGWRPDACVYHEETAWRRETL